MARAVLGSGPAKRWHRLAWQLPPAVDDVLAPHVSDLAWALAGEQDHLESRGRRRARRRRTRPRTCGSSDSDKTRSRLRVALRSTPRQGLAGRISCLTAQEKIALSGGQHLVGQHRGLDAGHQGLDVGAGDARGLQLAPARQHVAADQVSACRQALFLRLAWCST